MSALDYNFVANRLWLLIAVVTFPLTALAALAGAGPLVPVIFVTGYFLLVPLFLLFGDDLANLLVGPPGAEASEPDDAAPDSEQDPVETLKRRYASGEIDEREFERRVERIVALDDVDATDADLDALLGAGSSTGDPGTSDFEEADVEEFDVEREL